MRAALLAVLLAVNAISQVASINREDRFTCYSWGSQPTHRIVSITDGAFAVVINDKVKLVCNSDASICTKIDVEPTVSTGALRIWDGTNWYPITASPLGDTITGEGHPITLTPGYSAYDGTAGVDDTMKPIKPKDIPCCDLPGTSTGSTSGKKIKEDLKKKKK